MAGILAKAPPDSLFELATDKWTEPYWEACRQRRLVVMRCPESGAFRFPPSPFDATSRSQNVEWVESSGNGIIHSYTVVSRVIIPSMIDCIPYVPAVIELPDVGSVKLISNVVDSPVEAICIGHPVRLTWYERPDGIFLPRFILADA